MKTRAAPGQAARVSNYPFQPVAVACHSDKDVARMASAFVLESPVATIGAALQSARYVPIS